MEVVGETWLVLDSSRIEDFFFLPRVFGVAFGSRFLLVADLTEALRPVIRTMLGVLDA